MALTNTQKAEAAAHIERISTYACARCGGKFDSPAGFHDHDCPSAGNGQDAPTSP